MKIAISLFPDEMAAEKAVKALTKEGLDPDDVELYTQNRIENEISVNPIPGGAGPAAGGTTATGTAGGATGTAGGGAVLNDENVRSFLSSRGVDDEALNFFVHGIKEHGTIVIASPNDEDSIKKAETIMKNQGGKTVEEKI
jgi:hypothetical protein